MTSQSLRMTADLWRHEIMKSNQQSGLMDSGLHAVHLEK